MNWALLAGSLAGVLGLVLIAKLLGLAMARQAWLRLRRARLEP